MIFFFLKEYFACNSVNILESLSVASCSEKKYLEMMADVIPF